jgi:hypothetical protein
MTNIAQIRNVAPTAAMCTQQHTLSGYGNTGLIRAWSFQMFSYVTFSPCLCI